MISHSILFINILEREALKSEAPGCFIDLNLNQIVDAIVSGKEEYDLKTFFYTSLGDTNTIAYRQEIMQDMENPVLFGYIGLFAESMRMMRKNLPKPDKSYYKYQKERLFLDSVEIYCNAVMALTNSLFRVSLKSAGLITFRDYLKNHIQSTRFTSLLAETEKLVDDLSAIRYCILTKGLRVQVIPYKSEMDYSAEVNHTFDKFKRDAVKDYRIKTSVSQDMNRIEAQILAGVATLYPDIFKGLEDYYAKNGDYLDETIAVFDREIQFYIAYLEYLSKFKQAGLKFCYPEMSGTSKDVYSYEEFDLALAYKLISQNIPVVSNDFYLQGKERIIIVTGPNQGGKTTFARTFGQLQYLANLGCPVAGSKAKLFLFDSLFTHFEKEENLKNLRSKLEDDLLRIHNILNKSTPHSIIIMNEILSSTTLQDAIFLSKKIMEKIEELDVLCVWVTFIDELTQLSEKTISMVSTVEAENPALRTFKVVRKPADGLAYAQSLAEKYRITYDYLKERIQS